jgi:ribosomal protein S3AE
MPCRLFTRGATRADAHPVPHAAREVVPMQKIVIRKVEPVKSTSKPPNGSDS